MNAVARSDRPKPERTPRIKPREARLLPYVCLCLSLVGIWRVGTVIPGTPDTSRVGWSYLLRAKGFAGVSRAEVSGPLDQRTDFADLRPRV
jgi:hypothetical protein